MIAQRSAGRGSIVVVVAAVAIREGNFEGAANLADLLRSNGNQDLAEIIENYLRDYARRINDCVKRLNRKSRVAERKVGKPRGCES